MEMKRAEVAITFHLAPTDIKIIPILLGELFAVALASLFERHRDALALVLHPDISLKRAAATAASIVRADAAAENTLNFVREH